MTGGLQKKRDSGRPIAEYVGHGNAGSFVMFVIGVVGNIVAIWAMMHASLPIYLRGLVVLGAVLALASIEGSVNTFREYEIRIHEHGFVCATIMESRAVGWEEVAAVWQAKFKRYPNGPPWRRFMYCCRRIRES
jgi:hypothetical protein